MATNTENYGLTKPDTNEYYDISVQNGNMDKIDAQLKVNADNQAAHKADAVAHMTQEQKDQLAAAVPNSRKINGHALTGDVNLTKSDLGLGNVDNTADANKSVNYANSAGYAGSAGSAPANGGTAEKASYASGTVDLGVAGVRNIKVSSAQASSYLGLGVLNLVIE